MHILVDVLRNSVLITGLVVVMMMMIESVNIESNGRFFNALKRSRFGEIVFSSLLGSIPGCMGGFATVSLYTHRMISFGALVAMMIASSGDEAFVMLAMMPGKALWLMLALFVIAVITGYIVDIVYDKIHAAHHTEDVVCDASAKCEGTFQVHKDVLKDHKSRHFSMHRILLLAGLLIFIIALGSGLLEHGHHEHHEMTIGSINLLEESWMNVLFAILSMILFVVLIFASDHFIEEHIWDHIVKKHLPVIFGWTFGVLAFVSVCGQLIDLDYWLNWLSASHTRELAYVSIMIVLAALIGLIPESGPHMIFVTLFVSGVIPLPVLLASSISQDGHASIPLLAESKSAFFKAKGINLLVAILVGFGSMAFIG